jgi:Sulfotransferase family
MALLEVTDVSRLEPGLRAVDGWLNNPKPGDSIASYGLPLIGAAVGTAAPVQRIEAHDRGDVVWQLPLNWARPALGHLFPNTPWAPGSGFFHFVSALKLPKTFELDIVAVLEDDSCEPISTVKGTRSPLEESPSRYRPVLLMTLGRTGSTRAVALIAEHPEVVAFRPHDHEPKLVQYWSDVFETLSEPASYRESLASDLYAHHWWMGLGRTAAPAPQLDAPIEQWLGDRNVDELAKLCRSRVDAFYEQVATTRDKTGARYFVEKAVPAPHHERIWPDLYPGARVVFLVRDFRDVACSMLAYDGGRGFGREEEQSSEDFIRDGFATVVHRLVRTWQGCAGDAHLMRYEDLVLQPEQTLKSVFEFLELDASDRVVTAALEHSLTQSPQLQQQHRTSETFLRSVGRWQRDMSASDRAACEESCGDALETFGYPLSNARISRRDTTPTPR